MPPFRGASHPSVSYSSVSIMHRSVVRFRWCLECPRSRPRCVSRPSRRFGLQVATRVAPLRAKKQKDTLTAVPVREEDAFAGLTEILDSVKWSQNENLVPVIVQHVDTGELLMQAYADRSAISETLQTNLATFYSRSREERWCKGETSGNYIHVSNVYLDCDRDSIVYLGDPDGPSCHTGARTCWFHEVKMKAKKKKAVEMTSPMASQHAPQTTLYRLEDTIEARREEADQLPDGSGMSWTAKLLEDPNLLCSKIIEETHELCDAFVNGEGSRRTAEEMADLLYHCLVLLNKQGVRVEDVLRVLRGRFGKSGIQEKASRTKN